MKTGPYIEMRVESNLKKYAKLNGYTAMVTSRASFIKHLSMKFNFSEFELIKATRNNKLRFYI